MSNSHSARAVLYVHGMGGSAEESRHYEPLFPDCAVVGLDYQTFTPWETGKEIRAAVEDLKEGYDNVILIANSIGAFFSMHAGIDGLIQKAYFISPIVDMEALIGTMMRQADVSKEELEAKGTIRTASGVELSWEYLRYVCSHPLSWHVPTEILYGGGDEMTALEAVLEFAETYGANLTVMAGGEHWFHTEEQMRFLDEWIAKGER